MGQRIDYPEAQAPAVPLVTAEDLSAGYPGKVVWQNANFTVGQGEFVAVIGPNGAGKTTLFRLLLGVRKPLSGALRIFGADPKWGSPRIGYVPLKHAIDVESHIESLELVWLGLTGRKWGFSILSHEDRGVALSAMEAVGATDLAHRPLAELSGGELQRVFLAEALVSTPDVLLLDEPLSNLDMKREADLLNLINNVVKTRNVTAFLIAHNINPLLPYLDKVIYMANGKLTCGRPNEVLTSENLSSLYETRVEVLRGSRGNIAVVGVEESH